VFVHLALLKTLRNVLTSNPGRLFDAELAVDDEPQIVELLRAYLKREGFEVAEAIDGDAARREHERVRPDLVILDLILLPIDGRAVCQRMHALAGRPRKIPAGRVAGTLPLPVPTLDEGGRDVNL